MTEEIRVMQVTNLETPAASESWKNHRMDSPSKLPTGPAGISIFNPIRLTSDFWFRTVREYICVILNS